jgi:type VI protein secretion system component Hcp
VEIYTKVFDKPSWFSHVLIEATDGGFESIPYMPGVLRLCSQQRPRDQINSLYKLKGDLKTMFLSTRVSSLALSAALCWLPFASAQDNKSAESPASVTVAVDGLSCSSSAQGVLTASAFAINATTTSSSGGGGAGAGKTTFTDLAIQRPSDNCSVPLFMLVANGQIIKRVVLTETDKQHGSSLTMTLENVQVMSSTLRAGTEVIDFSYAAITITDGAGHTTGRITRQPGSVPISLIANVNSPQEI